MKTLASNFSKLSYSIRTLFHYTYIFMAPPPIYCSIDIANRQNIGLLPTQRYRNTCLMFPLCIKVFVDVADKSPPAVVVWVQRGNKEYQHFRAQQTSAVVDQWNDIANTFIQQNDASHSNQPHCQCAASRIEIKMFVGAWRPFISAYNSHT